MCVLLFLSVYNSNKLCALRRLRYNMQSTWLCAYLLHVILRFNGLHSVLFIPFHAICDCGSKNEASLLGGVLNPNIFGGFLAIFSLFVNNCKWNSEKTQQCLIDVLSNIIAKKYLMFLLPHKFTSKNIVVFNLNFSLWES